MKKRIKRPCKALFLFTMMILGLLSPLTIPKVNASPTGFPNPAQVVPMGTTLSTDSKIQFFDASPISGTPLKNDTRIKFVDANFNGRWDVGETVVYDSDNNGIYDYGEPLIAGSAPTLGASLSSDPKVKFVDTDLNGAWDLGETVVYEKSGGPSYVSGDPVIGGIPPIVGGVLFADAKVKYVDSGGLGHWVSGDSVVYASNGGNNFNSSFDPHIKFAGSGSSWTAGNSVIYDSNNNGIFDSGDIVIAGSTPTLGTSLKTDRLIKFLDRDLNGVWDAGEAVVYDTNNDNVYEAGEPIIANSNPTIGTQLSLDNRISYVDIGNLGHWTQNDPVVYASNGGQYYNAPVDPLVKYFNSAGMNHWVPGDAVIRDNFNDNTYDAGDPILYGSAPQGAPLTFDPLIKIVDTDHNGRWDSGESVVYDSNNNNVFDNGETVIYGAAPPVGTQLLEPVIAGSTPVVGTSIKTDPKMKYVETGGDPVWDPGEAVIYDNDTNNVYDLADQVIVGTPPISGSLLREPNIAGPVPSIGASLKTDQLAKIVDLDNNGKWDQGEPVVYDTNNNNRYDTGESIIAGGAGPDGVWDPGETVVYDTSGNGLYDSGEPVINGTTPLLGTVLRRDAAVKFVDTSNLGHWASGDTVIYDSNNTSVYSPGDPIISGGAPSPLIFSQPSVALDYRGRIWLAWNEKVAGSLRGTQVFLKLWNGTSWTNKQQVTSDATNVVDSSNFVLALPNQTMMIFWTSNKTGRPNLYYRTYSASTTNPTAVSNPIQLTSSSYLDRTPSAVSDRYGRIWVTWARQNTTITGCPAICSNIYYKYYNGTVWSNDIPLPPAANPNLSEVTPSIGTTKDGRVWIVWASNDTGLENLYRTTTDATVQTLPRSGLPSSSWASRLALVPDTTDDDQPFFLQSRDGTMWIFYQKIDQTLPYQYMYYISSADNGATWSPPAAVTSASEDSSPSSVQMTDHRIWLFWSRQLGTTPQVMYTTSDQINGVYDIGLRGILETPRLVRSGWSIVVNVTATNYGDFNETGSLTLRLNSTTIENVTQTYVSGRTYLFSFNWTSHVGFWGRYILNATINPAVTETLGNQGDNKWSAGLVRISPPGDLDLSGCVDIVDAASLGIVYDKPVSVNPYADVDRDGSALIDIQDAATLGIYYNKTVNTTPCL